MEPENIGIISAIDSVHKEPEKFAFVIARRTARLIMKEILKKEQNTPGSLSGNDRMLLGSLREIKPGKGNLKEYWDTQAQFLESMVVNLIREHAGETIKDFHGDITTRELAGHASLQLLSDMLERKNKHALAHYLTSHSTSHAQDTDSKRKYSLQFLGDQDRLTLLDHGIVNPNPIGLPLLNNEKPPREIGSRIWMGHDTPPDYDGTDTSKQTNILVEMTQDKQVIRVIEGTHLARQNDIIIAVNKTSEKDVLQVTCYTEPVLDPETISNYKTQVIHTADADIGTYKSTPITKIPYTDWVLVEVVGEKGSLSIALNKSSFSESFETHKKVLKLDNSYFIVDELTQEITIFAKTGLIKKNIMIESSFGVHGNAFYFIDTAEKKQKMAFHQGELKITDISTEEEAFFKETK